MKVLVTVLIFMMGSLFIFNADAENQIIIHIRSQQAKNIYNLMTGSTVQNEGAAGHLYRTGKNILCRYTDVDMSDHYGHVIPMQDSIRYECAMQFDLNGIALPSKF